MKFFMFVECLGPTNLKKKSTNMKHKKLFYVGLLSTVHNYYHYYYYYTDLNCSNNAVWFFIHDSVDYAYKYKQCLSLGRYE